MTRARDISKIVTDADLSGTLDVTGVVTAGGLSVSGTGVVGTLTSSNNNTVLRVKGNGAANGGAIGSTSSDDLVLLSSLTERMRITSGGNVGIGTTNPSAAKLQVGVSAGTNGLNITDGSASDFVVTPGISSGVVRVGPSVGSMAFYTNTERMRITDGGNVGIGTSSPNEKLTISSGAISFLGDISTPSIGAGLFRPANNTLAVVTGSTERMRIDTSGRVGIGNSVVAAGDADDLVVGTGTGNRGITIYSANNGAGSIYFSDGTSGSDQYDGYIAYSHSTRTMYLYTGINYGLNIDGANRILTLTDAGTERFRIDSSGNVGIGQSSPGTKLHVLGNSRFGNSNAITANANADSVVIENSGSAGINILSGSSSTGNIFFGDSSDNNVGEIQYNHSTNSLAFNVNASERMRINSSGNVGIGATNPSTARLQVREDTNASDTLQVSSQLQFAGQYHDLAIGIDDFYAVGMRRHLTSSTPAYLNPRLDFFVQNNNTYLKGDRGVKMTILNNGDVLIGTTSYAAGGNGKMIQGTGQVFLSRSTTGQAGQLVFQNPNGSVGQVVTSGTSTAYNTTSDHRLKENVVEITDATTRLKQLNPVRFNFIADADTTVDGFLAHEVQSVVPEAITGTHNEVEVWKDGEELPDGVSVGDNKLDEDGNTIPVYQGIDQSKLVPLLVKTIQELEARIVALETA